MTEGEPKREPVKNEGELDEQTKTKIINHLNYQEEETLNLTRVCARLSPASAELEKDTTKYYKKLTESLKNKNGKLDKNILYELSLPGREEKDLKEEIDEELKLVRLLTPEETIGKKGQEFFKKISKMETLLLAREKERNDLIEKVSKDIKRKGKEIIKGEKENLI